MAVSCCTRPRASACCCEREACREEVGQGIGDQLRRRTYPEGALGGACTRASRAARASSSSGIARRRTLSSHMYRSLSRSADCKRRGEPGAGLASAPLGVEAVTTEGHCPNDDGGGCSKASAVFECAQRHLWHEGGNAPVRARVSGRPGGGRTETPPWRPPARFQASVARRICGGCARPAKTAALPLASPP